MFATKSNGLNHYDELPRPNYGGYGGSLVAPSDETCTRNCPDPSSMPVELIGKSVGMGYGSVVGCNANNGNASARTANCNNRADNSNDNYAGAFAVNDGISFGTIHATRASSTKITDKHAATGGYAQCDYGLLPYWGDNAESNAEATDRDAESIWAKLENANSKRKLKNLKGFFLNREIVEYGFDRCMRNASPSPEIEYYKNHR